MIIKAHETAGFAYAGEALDIFLKSDDPRLVRVYLAHMVRLEPLTADWLESLGAQLQFRDMWRVHKGRLAQLCSIEYERLSDQESAQQFNAELWPPFEDLARRSTLVRHERIQRLFSEGDDSLLSFVGQRSAMHIDQTPSIRDLHELHADEAKFIHDYFEPLASHGPLPGFGFYDHAEEVNGYIDKVIIRSLQLQNELAI